MGHLGQQGWFGLKGLFPCCDSINRVNCQNLFPRVKMLNNRRHRFKVRGGKFKGGLWGKVFAESAVAGNGGSNVIHFSYLFSHMKIRTMYRQMCTLLWPDAQRRHDGPNGLFLCCTVRCFLGDFHSMIIMTFLEVTGVCQQIGLLSVILVRTGKCFSIPDECSSTRSENCCSYPHG